MKTITLLLGLLTVALSPEKPIENSINPEEKQGILLMREEEKLAHDVYRFLYEKWQLPVFDNISKSEIRHFNAVGTLLQNFDLNDPAISEEGLFTNPELEHLYDSLTLSGSKSLTTALEAAAFIEEVDIKDLQELLANTSNQQIAGVYSNLLRASGNHLRAFTGQLNSRGNLYEPQVLEPSNYNEIIQSQHQRGSGNGACSSSTKTSENQGNKRRFRNRGGNR